MLRLLCLFALLASGCGTLLSFQDQELEIRTEPSGADIFVDGKYQGKTPRKVTVQRSSAPEVELQIGNARKKVTLQSHYRLTVGLANILAPVYGHLIDYITGNAWYNDAPDVVHFDDLKEEPTKATVVILPPLYEGEQVSDDIVKLLKKQLAQTKPDYQVLPHKYLLPLFDKYGIDNYATTTAEEGDKFRNELLQYGVTHIVESTIFKVGNTLKVRGLLVDLKNSRAEVDLQLEEKYDALPVVSSRKFGDRLRKRFVFLPNTITYDFATESHHWTDFAGNPETANRDSAITALSLLGRLGLAYFKPATRKRFLMPEFTFIPGTWATHDRWKLHGFEPYEFSRLGIGYGFMAGLRSKWGFFYYKTLIGPEWAQFKQNGVVGRSLRLGSVNEFGWIYYIMDRIALRFFSKTSEVPDIYARSALSNQSSANSTYGGFSLGYYFPEQINEWVGELAQ